MPRVPVPRRLWDAAARLLGRELSNASTGLGRELTEASTALGRGLSDASTRLGRTLSDAADGLWDQEPPGAGRETWGPSSALGSGRGPAGGGRGPAGGGRGGFGGPEDGAGSSFAPFPRPHPIPRPGSRIEISLEGALRLGGALVMAGGLLVVGALGARELSRPSATTAYTDAPAPTAAPAPMLNGAPVARVARAEPGGGSAGDQASGAWYGSGLAPGAVLGAGEACRTRDGWYALPPTPTPTPLPRPLSCAPGRVLEEPPRVVAFEWEPAYPTLATQGRPDPETGLVDFWIRAQGGQVYRPVSTAQGCRLELVPDPLVRIEMDWVLLPPSAAWIHGDLARRYSEAYSRAAEQGIRCAVVWEGHSPTVSTVYADWAPVDPGLYGVRVHLYTAGAQSGRPRHALAATPVPVYLRDVTLWEETP